MFLLLKQIEQCSGWQTLPPMITLRWHKEWQPGQEWPSRVCEISACSRELLMVAFLLCAHMTFPLCMCLEVERERESLCKFPGISFIKTLILLDWGPPLVVSLNLNYFLRGPTSKDMQHGAGSGACVRILVYEFRGDTNIQFIKM